MQVVLRADTRRTELFAEEKRLTEAVQGSDDPALQAALNKVYVDLDAIGAHAAEGKARRILAVCRRYFLCAFLLLFSLLIAVLCVAP